MIKTTARHQKFWKNRKIDWEKDYFSTADHPHRDLIIRELAKEPFASILEIGCASGPNLYRIQKAFPNVQVGGIDINEDAIEAAKRLVPSAAVLMASSAENLFLSDKSADVILTDMALIYIDPTRIGDILSEIKRVARKKVIFVEFHSKSWWKRALLAIGAGYWAYDWVSLLEAWGFYDIRTEKIEESSWPGGEPQKSFGYIITAHL